MLISTDWVSDFTKIPSELSPQELGIKFTMATAEVEEVISTGAHFEKIRVAEIVKVEPHPDADKLRLVTFNYGEKEPKRVVCGASNVRLGLKTPYAPLGITLPNGLTLEPKKIRGVLSEGMLCSEEELGYAEESSGIMELPEDAPVGKTLLEYFNEKKDVVLDVDNKSLTHRPDLWGMYGIAREFAAIFGNPLKNPFDESWKQNLAKQLAGDSPVKVKVDSDSCCTGYFGLSVDNVKVGESPDWMKRRLLAVGLRPINNIVDISNYVMMELGHPNHIFDREQIKGGEVHIKKLSKEEVFVTLDEVERPLVAGDTVISDRERTLVLAGIMGGLNSGVTEKTTSVFLEVANWKAAEVRHTSTRLGLRTDSSQRFEKTLDCLQMKRTMFRLLDLVQQLCPGAKVVGKLEYDGPNLNDIKTLTLHTSAAKISRVLGHVVCEERVKEILSALDFTVQGSGDLTVTVPSYRATKDVECEDDIIEEIGRIIGYDNITPTSPKLDINPVRLTAAQSLHRKVRDFMTYHGQAIEIMTYPMVGEKLNQKANWPDKNELVILNSLSKDHDRMRVSLVPSFLEAAAKNTKNMSEFRFFELGRSYHPDQKEFSNEKSLLGIAFYDKEQTPFMDLLNTVQKLMNAQNIPGDFCERHPKFKNTLLPEDWSGVHPFEFLNIRIMGKMNGVVASVHPLMMRNFKMKGHLSLAFLDLTELEARPLKDKTKYQPLPKFPSSTFDWTVVADKDEPVGNVVAAALKTKIKEMVSCKLVDVFSLNQTQKTVTLRATFLDPEKTLSGDFLDNAQKSLVSSVEKAGYPLKS